MNKPLKNIPSIGPSITRAEVALITEAAREGWYGNMNRHLDLFNDAMRQYVNKKYCLPVSHGTAAIHLSLLGLGIGPGDEVIVPDITWVASAAPVGYVGARPVFADMDAKTWCLCPGSFERCITKRTKAVVVVDLFGNMPDMKEILRIARKNRIAVIEDAAEATGAEYAGRPAGSLCDIGIFSFNATKLVIAGQGGMLVTDNKKVFERSRLYSHHGIVKKPNARYYWSTVLGYNYNWTNIQAAFALAQLRRLPELVAHRRKVFGWYQDRLGKIEGLSLNETALNSRGSCWITAAIVDRSYRLKKEKIQLEFKRYGIDARPFFYPISSMPPYRPYCQGRSMSKENPVSYELSPYGICLPSGAMLKRSDVDRVCQAFVSILSAARKKRG
ncbi:MAG: DegT/DnrJ/EryC1/StrS family aminotransferase [Candidatus Omnitrophica bacterium]|nr:DegT/DnrJ/EryC1/StrS family aminotransferase [Candidatus Omnitrophota bacterium]